MSSWYPLVLFCLQYSLPPKKTVEICLFFVVMVRFSPQIHALGDACTRFLEAQLDPCNCIGMSEFAETHSLSDLFSKASKMIMHKFADVVVVRLRQKFSFYLFYFLHELYVVQYMNSDGTFCQLLLSTPNLFC